MLKSIILALLLTTPLLAQDATVNVKWDQNTESDLAGYKIHFGTQSQNYTNTVDAETNRDVNVGNLNRGTTYYFAVTAYDQTGNQSGFSQEVTVTIPETQDTEPPKPPANVRVTIAG